MERVRFAEWSLVKPSSIPIWTLPKARLFVNGRVHRLAAVRALAPPVGLDAVEVAAAAALVVTVDLEEIVVCLSCRVPLGGRSPKRAVGVVVVAAARSARCLDERTEVVACAEL